MKRIFKGLLCLCFVACTATPGWSSTMYNFDLTTGNDPISGYAGPYANVVVSLLDSTHASITAMSYDYSSTGGKLFLLGDGGTLGLNVNAASFLASVTGSTNIFGESKPFVAGPGNEDGFGRFNMTFNNCTGYADGLSSITVLLQDNSATWATAEDVLTGNGSGHTAAAHIFVSADGTLTGGSLGSGFATDGPATVPTPEPGSMMLLGAGFLGLAVYRKRRKNQ
jgi:hypothetical protein